MTTINDTKRALRAAGYKPGDNNTTKAGYYVFRDEYYGIIVQVTGMMSNADYKKHLQAFVAALKAAGIRTRVGCGGLVVRN